jgi:hypothetical protein
MKAICALLLLSATCSLFGQSLVYRKTADFFCPEGKTTLTEIASDPDGPWSFEDASKADAVQSRCKSSSPAAPRAHHAKTTTIDDLPAITPAKTIPVAGPISNGDSDSGFFGFSALLLIGCAYFFPMAVAMHRDCDATAGIAIVNIFLGWTFIGWVVALAWAASGKTKPKQATSAQIPT